MMGKGADRKRRWKENKRTEGTLGQYPVYHGVSQYDQGPSTPNEQLADASLRWLLHDIPSDVNWWWQDGGWLMGLFGFILLLLIYGPSLVAGLMGQA